MVRSSAEMHARVLFSPTFQFIGEVPVLNKLLDLFWGEWLCIESRYSLKRVVSVSIGTGGEDKTIVSTISMSLYLPLYPGHNVLACR
jgi:hypothetical protein